MSNTNVLITTPDERWEPGIGDPSLIGWFTVIAYFAAAGLCARACFTTVRLAKGQPKAREEGPKLAQFWFAAGIGLIGLGINKQLDLQSLFTQILRDLAMAQGWYENRRHLQVLFILTIACLAFVAGIFLIWSFRKVWRGLISALFGIVFIVAFVTVRAASFHHVDVFLFSQDGLNWNWILELGGIALIAYSAWVWRPPWRPKVGSTPTRSAKHPHR